MRRALCRVTTVPAMSVMTTGSLRGSLGVFTVPATVEERIEISCPTARPAVAATVIVVSPAVAGAASAVSAIRAPPFSIRARSLLTNRTPCRVPSSPLKIRVEPAYRWASIQ
jgi:hypothetical protein